MRQQLDELVERLRAYFAQRGPASVMAAFLFGGHAAGRAGRESDVDVAVVLEPGPRGSRLLTCGCGSRATWWACCTATTWTC